MRLNVLHLFEYHKIHADAYSFYKDPKWSNKTDDDTSLLVGGKKDRNKFLKNIGMSSKNKRKKKK